MSNFVKITNPAGNIDRRFLEKLGISSKRDDESSIGQFGSGAKLAPIAALRKNIRWITVAKDDLGPYTLEYVVRDVDGIEVIYYKYDDCEKESSFTLDAGVLSWDEDFQMFREAFSNAVDSGSDYSIEIVDEIEEYKDGYISVYLTAAPEITNIIDNFDKYFSFHRTPIVSTDYGDIYSAAEVGHSRFYNKGVLVDDKDFSEVINPCFDWGFKDVVLNEERRIRHYWQNEELIRKLLINLPNNEDGQLFAKLCIQNEPAEFTHILNTYSIPYDKATVVSSVWSATWISLFGDKVIPVHRSSGCDIIADNLQAQGYRARFTTLVLANLMYNSGILSPEELLGKKSNIKMVECPGEHIKVLEHAIRTAARYDKRIHDYKISVMDDSNNLGMAVMGQGEEEIFVSKDCLDFGFKKIVGTLIHELDHVTSGIEDSDFRRFRNLADERIVDLLVDAGYSDDLTAGDGSISIDLNYLASLGTLEYDVVSSEFGSILRIGDNRFFVDATMVSGKGVMKVGEDNGKLMIEANEVTEATTIKRV